MNRQWLRLALFVLIIVTSINCNSRTPSSRWQYTETSPHIAFKYVNKYSGAPTLLIVHGGPGDNSAYLIETLGKQLENKYNIIWYDQRGAGKSERDLSYDMYAITAHVEDIKRVQEAAGVDKVILVAHSWGGVPAGIYAAKYPEKVRAFVNINGTGSFLDIDDSLIKSLKIYFHDNLAKLDEIKAIEGLPHGFLRFIKRAKLAREAGLYYKDYPKTKKEIADYLKKAVEEGEYSEKEIEESEDALYLPMEYDSLDTVEIYSALAQVKAPTLIIAGMFDKVVSVESLKKYQLAISGAKLIVFEDSGHHPFQEEPDKFYQTFDGFMASLENH